MKEKIFSVLAIILCFCMLGSGFAIAAEEAENTEPDFENWETVVTEGVFDIPIVWEKLPSGYTTQESEHPGTVLRLHYTTDAYEDGVTYEKYCTVYLPYGYDEQDTETKYNVIYFQHGNSGSPNEFWDHILKTVNCNNIFNNMFDGETQLLEKCIIICPTFYLETPEDEYTTPKDNPSGDGRSEGIPANYFDEVIDDLIPQIESQFNVYCEDFSREGIKASRNHRAWAGYSRGGRCTWNMLHHDFEYFKYWMPCSGIVDPVDGTDVSTVEAAYEYVMEKVFENPDLDFYLMGYVGGSNDQKGRESLVELMQYMYEQKDVFSYGTNPAENNFYFVISDFNHNDLYFPYILANYRNFLFK